MTLLISPQSCVRPSLISPPLAACSGESQLHTHLYCFHSSYAGRGGSTEEGRDRGRPGSFWFTASGSMCVSRGWGASTTLLSVTTSSITLTPAAALHHSQFPGTPSGISHYYLRRGNLLKYKYVLWWICYACQPKHIFSSIKLRCVMLACLNDLKDYRLF